MGGKKKNLLGSNGPEILISWGSGNSCNFPIEVFMAFLSNFWITESICSRWFSSEKLPKSNQIEQTKWN